MSTLTSCSNGVTHSCERTRQKPLLMTTMPSTAIVRHHHAGLPRATRTMVSYKAEVSTTDTASKRKRARLAGVDCGGCHRQ